MNPVVSVTIAVLAIVVIVFAVIRVSTTEDRATQTVIVGVLPDQDVATLKMNFDPFLNI